MNVPYHNLKPFFYIALNTYLYHYPPITLPPLFLSALPHHHPHPHSVIAEPTPPPPSLRACTQAWQSTLSSFCATHAPLCHCEERSDVTISALLFCLSFRHCGADPPLPSLRACDCGVAIHSFVMLRHSREHLCSFVIAPTHCPPPPPSLRACTQAWQSTFCHNTANLFAVSFPADNLPSIEA
jgi:hypothetical protein